MQNYNCTREREAKLEIIILSNKMRIEYNLKLSLIYTKSKRKRTSIYQNSKPYIKTVNEPRTNSDCKLTTTNILRKN